MNSECTIFVVDDEESMRMAVSQWLTLSDYTVESFSNAKIALKNLSYDFDGVLVTDIRMPGMDGLELMRHTLALDKEIPVVLITAHGDIPMSVSAMREGAYDFIEKPFEPDLLLETVRRACEKRRLILENRQLRQRLESSSGIENKLLGNSNTIQLLLQEINDLGPTDASVLLIGETGSGKEVAARCLHQASNRNNEKFIAINCGAIPETLFESEFFGHEAGAFTGAKERRIGKFEHASGGTLFLDEINAMPPGLQVKVLRVLQEKEIERLGSNTTIPVDVRIMSATNSNPQEARAEGTFREDLYYRLSAAEIHIPPLRKRGGDILLLFDFFALRAAERYKREAPPLNNDDITALMTHQWPGNVRELKNIAERYVLSSMPAQYRIARILKQTETALTTEDRSLVEQASNFERCVLEQALRRHQGNIEKIMKELDIPRRTLNHKMQNHELNRKDFLKES